MRLSTAIIVAAVVAAPVPAIAQTQNLGEPEVQELGEIEDDEDDGGNSRLGLLGLLGLAGLLGLRRREPDIHVDARRDPRP